MHLMRGSAGVPAVSAFESGTVAARQKNSGHLLVKPPREQPTAPELFDWKAPQPYRPPLIFPNPAEHSLGMDAEV